MSPAASVRRIKDPVQRAIAAQQELAKIQAAEAEMVQIRDDAIRESVSPTQERPWQQQEVAKRVGLSKNRISQILRGE